MNWLSILSGALKLFNALATIFHNKQLMDAGEAKASARMSAEQAERVRRANSAVSNARNAVRVPDNAYRD